MNKYVITMLGKAVLCLTTLHFYSVSAQAGCTDIDWRHIKHGLHYVPGPENCKLCICDNGQPINCKMVICSPPRIEECPSYKLGKSCCEYICSDSKEDEDTEKPTEEPNADEHNEPSGAAAFIMSHNVIPTNGAEILLLTLGY